MQVQPQRAIVTPRVFAPDVFGPISIETEVLSLITGQPGAIAIIGSPGSGKSICLQHLASMFEHDERVVVMDNPSGDDVLTVCKQKTVIYAALRPLRVSHLAILKLALWESDQVLEYIAKKYPGVERNTVHALLQSADVHDCMGNPELLTLIVDAVISKSAISGRDAIMQYLLALIPDAEFDTLCTSAVLANSALSDEKFSKHMRLVAEAFRGQKNDAKIRRLFNHPLVQMTLASVFILRRLDDKRADGVLRYHLNEDLVVRVAELVRHNEERIAYLKGLVAGGDESSTAMAASILVHAVQWRPDNTAQLMQMSDGQFRQAKWTELKVAAAVLNRSNLVQADLANSELGCFTAVNANFERANLSRCTFLNFHAPRSNFNAADLAHISCEQCLLENSWFRDANLAYAKLSGAGLGGCDFRGAVFFGAILDHARFPGALLYGADFSHANLTSANLINLDLKETRLDNALLTNAILAGADLELVKWESVNCQGASFNRALLTGSTFKDVKMRGVKLTNAGIADIDWEGCDLRDVDFSRASFHLGSSRSGRVYSPIASEGSRTGFYTDEFHEQSFKAPEEIRKANLRGADLRGANVRKCDFYLVDLRDALYDDVQARHFRKCRAILEHRC